MHKVVGQNVAEYIETNNKIRPFFDRLVNAGKKLFLVTNSPYHFVYVDTKQIHQIKIIQIKLFSLQTKAA